MVKFENREIWADLENRSKVVHSENFPIWRPASGVRDHVTHHVTSHVTHWGQWKYASRSWHAVGNHRRQLKLMYWSKISGRGPKHCSGSKFQCRPRPDKSLTIKAFHLKYQLTIQDSISYLHSVLPVYTCCIKYVYAYILYLQFWHVD